MSKTKKSHTQATTRVSTRRWSPLPVQVLLFLLGTVLAVATGIATNSTGTLLWSLPLAGITALLIVSVMVWQHRAQERLALPAGPVWDSDRSPFPGLEAFTEQDSAVFFGRDAEITELLDRLHPVVATQANRLVAVVGPSGAGKSSLVQAGVVAQLRQRRSGWIVVPPVVPGDHPLRSLARSFAAASPGHPTGSDVPAARFTDELRTAHSRPSAPVLVIVDQAEELITLSGEAERDAFLSLLTRALDTDPQLWIIMIMRSEFLTAFLGTEQARLFRDPVTVGTLSRAALVEVIEQPAQQAGLTFDPPALPQRMAADAGGGDALPLLAYALQELRRVAGPGGALTVGAYRHIGGVTGVLTRQADKVAAELGGADGLVLSTLLKFVTIGENEPTRHRVLRSALTDTQWRVAQAFITARLLTINGDGDDAILEVAHEALFRHWAPLQQAIEASADQLRWRADLERWAKDWDSSGRQGAYLLRDERLKAAQRWAAADGEVWDGLALVAEFLTCSNRADHATMQRLSETIARQALDNVERDPDYSLLLALAAYEECPPTALAVRAMTAALAASRVRAILRGHDDWVFWWRGHRTGGGSPPRHTTGPPGSGTPPAALNASCCAVTTVGFGRSRGHRTDSSWPPRPATGPLGSGTLAAAPNSSRSMATIMRFGRWRGPRTDSSWPPRRTTGQSGSGTPDPALRSSSSASTPKESTACPGPRTAGESPLRREMGPAGSGTRLSASRIWWPTPTIVSPGN